jgi:hypothetical protein
LSFLSSQGDSNSALEQLCDLYTAGITRNKHADQFSYLSFFSLFTAKSPT